MISSGLKSTPCSFPPRKCTSCAAAPNLISPSVRLVTFCARNTAGDKASAAPMPAGANRPKSHRAIPRNESRRDARIRMPQAGIAGANYKPRGQNQRVDALRRRAAALLLQKSNTIGSTRRPDQQKRPIGHRQRDRKLTYDLSIGLDRERAIRGNTRLSRAQDRDIARSEEHTSELQSRFGIS